MRKLGIAVGMSVLVGCGASQSTPEPTVDGGPTDNPDFFIARQIDFKDFRKWTKYKVYTAPDGGVETVDPGTDSDGGTDVQNPHPFGDRYAYINKVPPSGSTVFPTGTIILKLTVLPDGTEDNHMHAMVKRNGGFNSKGAVGWEWMELVPAADGAPVILWRDAVPPDGSGYFDPSVIGQQGDCNTCHAASRDNDFVQSAPLQLKNF